MNSPNLKLNVGDEIDLLNKVMEEVKLKRYAGPNKQIPKEFQDDYIQSPIGLVPKDQGRHMTYLSPLIPTCEGEAWWSCLSINFCE